ncbi:MAG: META domain-containing protein [Chloroflexi bacterium]|nr:META domain-containing protein [Chloroflexota bacterium]
MASTRRGCPRPAAEWEAALYGVLPEVRSLQVFRGDLLLLDADGSTRIQLRQGAGIGG